MIDLEIRKKEIELHFEKIIKNAKNSKQVWAFYNRIVGWMIPEIIMNSGKYEYEGVILTFTDLPIIKDIHDRYRTKYCMLQDLSR